MSKDPAFLFYSKDFYEGTRMMLPEERACYVDLLVYQHQNGIIPNDIKRLQMYCSGCSEETINRVLNQKFNQTVNGWLNQRLNQEKISRSEGKPKKIASATLAGLISSYKLSKNHQNRIKTAFKIENFIYTENEEIQEIEVIKTNIKEWFKQMVNQMVNNKANANEDVNANEDINKIEVKDEIVVSEKPKIEFQKIVNIFNSVCKNLPDVQKLTDQRKSAINARVSDYGLSKIGEVFQIVSNNEFLNGNNDRGWKADFDWVMNPNNFIKILEGKYQSNGKKAIKTNAEVFESAMESEVGRNFKFK